MKFLQRAESGAQSAPDIRRSRRAREAAEIAEEIRSTVVYLAMEARAQGLHVLAFLLEAAALEAASGNQVGDSELRAE